jgi:hypothetical protein
MGKIQKKLANNRSISLQDAISLQEIIKNDRPLNEKKKIEGMRTINEAAEVDIEKYSQRYFIDWAYDYSGGTLTDDAIKSYLQQELGLKVKLNDIPHKDAKFASLYATAASSILTGLLVYYAWHKEKDALEMASTLSCLIFMGEFAVCDVILDAGFSTSKVAYYLSSGIRVAVPAVVGLGELTGVPMPDEKEETGQDTGIKNAPSKKKEKEEFPDVWIEIPKDGEDEKIPNVWKKKGFER